MILHVFDDTFEYRGRVENWLNLSWTEEYRGEGKFTLATYDTDQYAALLRHGWYLFRADRPAAMMIVKIERDTDANTITACGYTALHLLGRRVVNGKANVKNIESGIYSLINTYLRGLTQISTATAKGLPEEIEPDDDTDTEGKEIEGEEVLDAVLDVLEESTYGIRANFDRMNKRHVVEVYAGVDRSYKAAQGGTLFKQEFGNLKSLTVTQDDDLYKNVAYVTGNASGDSENTTYYEYISPEVQNQKERREMIVDGDSQEDGESTADWQKRQKQKGITALNERKNALTFEVELGLGVFGEKYDLGDKVTCKSDRYGLQFDTRIMEYQYSYRAGKETEKIVLGNKPADYVKGEIIKSSGGGKSSAAPGGGGGGTVDMSAVLNAVYPVGAIYLSVNSASPQELFGGTWERLKDRFLLGAGDTYAAGGTGGEATHTLTSSEMPKHQHLERMPVQGYSGWGEMTTTSHTVAIDWSSSNNNYFGPGVKLNAAATGANGVTTDSSGNSAAHNNMPPYLAVYMWKRTA